MVEIKAFVRVNMVDKVIRALEAAGITNLTVIDVRAIWKGLKQDLHYSVELTERYMNVAKIETLARDDDAERIMELIRAAAHTGRMGDGIIYSLPVTDVVRVRTGQRGEAALTS